MSWYKRTPTVKNPPKPVAHRTSPATEKKLQESKLLGPTKHKD